MDDLRDGLVQQGWKQLETTGFGGHAGPIWIKGAGDDGDAQYGILIEPQHLNRAGVAHGGALAFFADTALSRKIIAKSSGRRVATMQLNVHFVSAAKLGVFVTADVEIVRMTNSTAFVRAIFNAEGKPVASADGMWKIFETRLPPEPKSAQ
jgi:uncharacterized protein (TIGR00369 family)